MRAQEVKCCENCPLFLFTDKELGTGICKATKVETICYRSCSVCDEELSYEGAKLILRQFQDYRRGDSDYMLPQEVYCKAIDVL